MPTHHHLHFAVLQLARLLDAHVLGRLDLEVLAVEVHVLPHRVPPPVVLLEVELERPLALRDPRRLPRHEPLVAHPQDRAERQHLDLLVAHLLLVQLLPPALHARLPLAVPPHVPRAARVRRDVQAQHRHRVPAQHPRPHRVLLPPPQDPLLLRLQTPQDQVRLRVPDELLLETLQAVHALVAAHRTRSSLVEPVPDPRVHAKAEVVRDRLPQSRHRLALLIHQGFLHEPLSHLLDLPKVSSRVRLDLHIPHVEVLYLRICPLQYQLFQFRQVFTELAIVCAAPPSCP